MKLLKKKLFGLFLMLALLGTTGIFGTSVEVTATEADATMTVHFLDVGQGLSILVQSGGENLLYDGGNRNASSLVVSYLQQQQVDTIDYLISSHYDSDHVSGLIGCLNAFDIGTVIGPDYVHDSGLYESFMEGVAANGLSVNHPSVGETFSFGTGSFTILAPQTIANDSNNNSVAIKLSNGEDDFIFTGDAEYSSEADMIRSGIDLDCEVLCLGHHGSASSTSWDFLEATVPEYAVISCGADNQYGHPHADTMEKLSSMEIEVFRTDEQGTIVAYSTGDGIFWSVDPCDDYTPGDETDLGTQAAGEAENDSYQESSAAQEESAIGEEMIDGSSDEESSQEIMVWLPASGEKYHSIPNCGRMNPDKARQVPISEAVAEGYDACSKCF